MRIVQFTLVALLLTSMQVIPVSAQNSMPPDSDFLAISAESEEGYNAVVKVVFWDGYQLVSILENQPFSVEVASSFPDEPTEILIALSDGNLYDVTEEAMDFRILYLIPYYGFVISKYPDGSYQTLNFAMHAMWKKPNYLPEKPELVVPIAEKDPLMQELIDRWWKYEVLVREAKRLADIEAALSGGESE